MSGFELLNIDNLGKLDRGRSRHRPRDDQSLYGGPYPFVQTGDIKHAPFYINTYSQTYSERGLQQSKLWEKGTLCITIAANISDTAILNFDACFPDSIVGFIPFQDKSDVRFVKYCFDVYKTTFEAISKGTTQDNLSLDKIRSVKFRTPPLPIQRKIAAVLSAYDDLIENNTRRIAILEKMAEELYREWFVRLRFPGHDKTKIVKGVPEGWGITKIQEVFKTTSGGTPSRQKESEYFGGAINWVKTGELKDTFVLSTDEKITESGLSASSAKVFPANTLIMAMYGVNIGQLGITTQPSATNQACCAFLPNKLSEYSIYYLFHYLKSIRFHLFNISMGAAQQNLSQNLIQRLDYVKPTSTLLSSFDEIQKPIFLQKIKFLQLNQTLIDSRDRLLSRLMSGKIDLEHLDIHFPPSMREEEMAHA